MSCGTQGEFVGPYISDPFALAQARLECIGLCSVNSVACIVDFGAVDCLTVDLVPDNFPVNV